MSDMLLPYCFKLPCVPVRGNKLKIYGTKNTPTTGSTTGMNKDMPLIVNNNHANPTQLHLLFIFRSKYLLESNNKNLYRIPHIYTQHKPGRVQAPTFTRTATASLHTQHYDVIWMC